jgi:hypothetical protein
MPRGRQDNRRFRLWNIATAGSNFTDVLASTGAIPDELVRAQRFDGGPLGQEVGLAGNTTCPECQLGLEGVNQASLRSELSNDFVNYRHLHGFPQWHRLEDGSFVFS